MTVNFSSTKTASLIAIALSLAILVFLCVYPVNYAKTTLNDIIDSAQECTTLCADSKFEELSQRIANLQNKLDSAVVVLKLFYVHSDVADVQQPLAATKQLIDSGTFDVPNIICYLSNVMEAARHIIECDNFGWQEFM